MKYHRLRIPTEWEWEWTAKNDHKDYKYPWGSEWNENNSNTTESGLSRTTAVGMYPARKTSYGAMDMSGNVYEWCLNEYRNRESVGLGGTKTRMLRGGSWFSYRSTARVYSRTPNDPFIRDSNHGFRVVVRPASLSLPPFGDRRDSVKLDER